MLIYFARPSPNLLSIVKYITNFCYEFGTAFDAFKSFLPFTGIKVSMFFNRPSLHQSELYSIYHSESIDPTRGDVSSTCANLIYKESFSFFAFIHSSSTIPTYHKTT